MRSKLNKFEHVRGIGPGPCTREVVAGALERKGGSGALHRDPTPYGQRDITENITFPQLRW